MELVAAQRLKCQFEPWLGEINSKKVGGGYTRCSLNSFEFFRIRPLPLLPPVYWATLLLVIAAEEAAQQWEGFEGR